MSILIEDEEQFKKLVENYQRALDYIDFLESHLDAAVYQEQDFNKNFARKEEDRDG